MSSERNASNLVLEILKHDKIWGGEFALASTTPNSGSLVPFSVIYAPAWYTGVWVVAFGTFIPRVRSGCPLHVLTIVIKQWSSKSHWVAVNMPVVASSVLRSFVTEATSGRPSLTVYCKLHIHCRITEASVYIG